MPKSQAHGKKRRAPPSSPAARRRMVAAVERYNLDCKKGAQAAKALIAEMLDARAPSLLGWRVEAMIKAGKYSGFEVGFFCAIAVAAMESENDHAPQRGGDFAAVDALGYPLAKSREVRHV